MLSNFSLFAAPMARKQPTSAPPCEAELFNLWLFARAIAKSVSGEPVTRWDVQEMVREAKKSLKPAYVDEEV